MPQDCVNETEISSLLSNPLEITRRLGIPADQLDLFERRRLARLSEEQLTDRMQILVCLYCDHFGLLGARRMVEEWFDRLQKGMADSWAGLVNEAQKANAR
jgi:hypothetical protein